MISLVNSGLTPSRVDRRHVAERFDHGAREFRRDAVNAEGHEVVGAEILVAGVAQVLDELARDVVDREREEVLLREPGIAERFHSLYVIGAGGEGKFAAAVAISKAAVEVHRSGVAAQLEVDGRIFCRRDVGIEADEVADLVSVAPGAVLTPTGRTRDLKIEAAAAGPSVEPGGPVTVNAVIGGNSGNARG